MNQRVMKSLTFLLEDVVGRHASLAKQRIKVLINVSLDAVTDKDYLFPFKNPQCIISEEDIRHLFFCVT